MNYTTIKTFGELKAAGYKSASIKEELRRNLIVKLQKDEETFPGIFGYENTVIPQVERALLSRHHFNLLGLRGQAKTRIARQMVDLLDEYIPVVTDSEINDDPFAPISTFAKEQLAKHGDNTPISWLHRSDRYYEKLATPDVTIADLIGDVDPIKAANLKISYSDERAIHFGMLPRANRCIFVINELPDLAARIQVALFNILQEGDVQIRGFKFRMPLDVQCVFTANPEDYTNRGSIVTPLKDRIGSQILTHYPTDLDTAMRISDQEAKISEEQRKTIVLPHAARKLVEQVAFAARESEYVDEKSGVSTRLAITALENLYSTAERRMLVSAEQQTTVRMSDIIGIVPSITGKIELVYEGEQEGAAIVSENLIIEAIRDLFNDYFTPIDKLKRNDDNNPYLGIVNWFDGGNTLDISEYAKVADYQKTLKKISPLQTYIENNYSHLPEDEKYFFMEFLLWGLAAYSKISRDQVGETISFGDLFSSYMRGEND
ncbi:MAG: magnesium chelatase [Schleiferiaceae bacterium]|nr:magnesium chelatase [Schleiferiaceae bacterium]